MNDRRQVDDRRGNNYEQERLFPANRRHRPDRRLNSIAAEWIPMRLAHSHPLTQRVFGVACRMVGKP